MTFRNRMKSRGFVCLTAAVFLACPMTMGFTVTAPSQRPTVIKLRESENSMESDMQMSRVRVDDGGSDLTDRFKYKVNALMGAFDPADSAKDTERQDGNILNAMLQFPVNYTFHVVGKTNDDEALKDQFIDNVKSTVRDMISAEEINCEVTPRGKKFTKVSIEAEMNSAETVAAMYDRFGQLELSVMCF